MRGSRGRDVRTPAPETTGVPALELRGVRVAYGTRVVLPAIDLSVAPGETLALLGPSGSGKTTLLSAIAGFVRVVAGEIRLDGRPLASPVADVPPERREVGVVFQGYALWPHLTALETVAYPLRRRGIPRGEAHRRALEILGQLGIAHLAGRRPAELSGGEQQRVGLGRALARDARIYLFDEPTAHLDASLRERLQDELAEHRRRLRAAAIYATHDSGEALAIADRVALMRDGRIVQTGDPAEVYARPVDLWTARLTGPASVLSLTVHAADADGARVSLPAGDGDVAASPVRVRFGAAGPPIPGPVRALVRPDWARLGGPLPARGIAAAYRGTHTDYRLATAGGEVGVRIAGSPAVGPGAEVGWTLERVWLLGGGDSTDLERADGGGQARASTPDSAGITYRP